MYIDAFNILNTSRRENLSITDIINYGNVSGFEDEIATFILVMQAADQVYLEHVSGHKA